jgi:hypothetical protein
VAGASIVGFAGVAFTAARLWPPATAIADRYLALAAVSTMAAVIACAATSWRIFERPHRLAAFVVLMTSAMVWYGGRLWVHERQFDYLVASQRSGLELRAIELSGDVVNFLRARERTAPPRPAPATWNRDTAALLRYEDETATAFEEMFGRQVRRAHDLLELEGLTDRDLDAFYRHPANAFQIYIVAEKLASLARRLDRM